MKRTDESYNKKIKINLVKKKSHEIIRYYLSLFLSMTYMTYTET